MRIALLATNLARGGAEAQVLLLASELNARGHEVAIVSLLEPSLEAPVPVYSLGMTPGKAEPAAMARLVALLRELRPHVLHAHMFHANLMARLAGLVCPVPVVSTLHSMAESGRESLEVGRRDLAYRVTDRLSKRTVAVAKAVAERHLKAGAVSAKRVRVIPNGIRPEWFRPDPRVRARARAELGLGEEFAWLAVGRLMWKKGFPTLVEAFEGLGGVLLIAGDGPDDERLRATAPPNVRLLGARDDVPALMQAADAFVLSSVVEGMPVVLLEAAASGLPIVSTDVGGTREAAPAALFAPPADASGLREAMKRMMSLSPGKRSALAERSRAHVVANCDIRVVASHWEALYRELA